MGVYIRWGTPPIGTSYTTVQIERASDIAATYSNIANVSIAANTYFDPSGSLTNYYRIRFSDGTNNSAYSSPMRGDSYLGYVSVQEVRKVLKLQEAEYSDDDIQYFINKGTRKVDETVDRTWQGLFEVRNELYNGTDKQSIYLNRTDIFKLTEAAIDPYGTGTFTSIPLSALVLHPEGKVYLNSNTSTGLSYSSFLLGQNNVRFSYVYGMQAPTESVKELCLLYIAQFIKVDPTRDSSISKLVNAMRYGRANLV